jgi:nitrous oxide reductase accessory protein NosL
MSDRSAKVAEFRAADAQKVYDTLASSPQRIIKPELGHVCAFIVHRVMGDNKIVLRDQDLEFITSEAQLRAAKYVYLTNDSHPDWLGGTRLMVACVPFHVVKAQHVGCMIYCSNKTVYYVRDGASLHYLPAIDTVENIDFHLPG